MFRFVMVALRHFRSDLGFMGSKVHVVSAFQIVTTLGETKFRVSKLFHFDVFLRSMAGPRVACSLFHIYVNYTFI